MRFVVALSALLALGSAYGAGNEWITSELALTGHSGELPIVAADNNSGAWAYVVRWGSKRESKIFFVFPDDQCRDGSRSTQTHFVRVNNEKSMLLSYCRADGNREAYSLVPLIVWQAFSDAKQVELREVDPDSGSTPISETYSAIGFNKQVTAYNIRSARI